MTQTASFTSSPSPTQPAARGIAALAGGAVFGLGLALAEMNNPLKVLGFLDVAGAWDASLLFVLGGAVLLAAAGFHLVLRRPAPLLDAQYRLPRHNLIDARLITGAALFGIGWGLGGYCPGPAIASLGQGNAEALYFVPAMLAGAAAQRWLAHQQQTLAGQATKATASAE